MEFKKDVSGLLVWFSIVMLFTIVAPGITNSQVSALSLKRCQNVAVIAHRGMSNASHTENTIRAFNRTADNGVNLIETDIRKTADDQWVFMHDVTVDRTTNGSGAVGKQTQKKIKTYKTDDGVKGGVPSLTEGLVFLRKHPKVQMHIEFKSSHLSDAAVQSVIDQANAQGVTSRIRFTSFDPTVLLQIQRLAPDVNVGLLSSVRVSAKTAAKFDNNVYIYQEKVSETYIAAMHKAGVTVGVWTVDTKTEWQKAVSRGADATTTDDPTGLRSYCRNAS